MDRGSWHFIGGSDQEHPQGKKRQNGCLRRPYKYLRKEKKKRKGRGEKERYIHLNAEFQQIARNKIVLLSMYVCIYTHTDTHTHK